MTVFSKAYFLVYICMVGFLLLYSIAAYSSVANAIIFMLHNSIFIEGQECWDALWILSVMLESLLKDFYTGLRFLAETMLKGTLCISLIWWIRYNQPDLMPIFKVSQMLQQIQKSISNIFITSLVLSDEWVKTYILKLRPCEDFLPFQSSTLFILISSL